MARKASRPSPVALDKKTGYSKTSPDSELSSAGIRTPVSARTPNSVVSSRSAYSETSSRSIRSAASGNRASGGRRASLDGNPNGSDDSSRGTDRGGKTTKRPSRTQRTWRHNAVRSVALFASLLLTLTRILIEPLYNSLPLNMHPTPLYIAYFIIPTVLYWRFTLSARALQGILARVCLLLIAAAGDIVAVFGRKLGRLSGTWLGAEWGATAALAFLGAGVVTGTVGFALLCFGHVMPIPPFAKPSNRSRHLVLVALLSGIAVAHVWVGELAWRRLLRGNVSALVQYPEKSTLCLSGMLTVISIIIRAEAPHKSFAQKAYDSISSRFKLEKKTSKQLWDLLSYLPSTVFPVLLLLRIPLLLLAVRQQLFLRPPVPYITSNNSLHILHSKRSLIGQIVIADNLQNGYRYMRCDASLLGGRFHLDRSGSRNLSPRLGDSIFGPFALQEVALLAVRNDESDTLARTLALTTRLRISPEEDEPADVSETERALIIGLGVGIAAQAFSHQNLDVDLVEIDPVVYDSAIRFFDLSLSASSTVNLIDGAEYVRSMASMVASGEIQSPRWRIAVQDCFTGGMVPGELFTGEFWQDLGGLMADDGIVAMNFVGLRNSKASQAVLVTLTSVFEQCRAFGDAAEAKANLTEKDSINMVVFCTAAYSPLLTFRKPTSADIRQSHLRGHMYSTFLSYEMQLDSIIQPGDRADPELMLQRGENKLDKWQVETALGTWRAMQRIFTPDMWMAY